MSQDTGTVHRAASAGWGAARWAPCACGELVDQRDILAGMGRDWTRVLIGAVGSIALIIAAALTMDWYRLTLGAAGGGVGRIAIDLQSIHICGPDHLCASAPLTPLPGMFPTLAMATLWSSLGLAALIAFQAGSRLLSGAASEALAKLAYLYALMTISLVVVTAYVSPPATEGPGLDAAALLGAELHRTWAPTILLVGMIGGFATLYMAVAPASNDMTAPYKPIHLPAARVIGDIGPGAPPSVAVLAATDAMPRSRSRTPTVPIPLRARPPTGAPGLAPGPALRTSGSSRPPTDPTSGDSRPNTGLLGRAEHTTGTGSRALGSGVSVAAIRNPAGSTPSLTGSTPSLTGSRPSLTGSTPSLTGSTPSLTGSTPSLGRTGTATLTAIPAHLRNRLSYVALTAELTAGGIDARREDGTARLVLWRDVVGVVARRLPSSYDGTLFVDIVSSAGSTLRIVPWTRLTGEPIVADGDARQRAVAERAVAMCPAAQVDAATRQFLDAGEAAQLPSVEALAAHDAHLA
jgi:hypothetical protein